MGFMHMGGDQAQLLQKRYQQNLFLLQVAGSIVLPTLSFVIVYLATAFDIRYYTPQAAFIIGPVTFVGMSAALTGVAIGMYLRGRPSRMWIALSSCMWVASVSGFCLADRVYWKYINPYFNYEDMAYYINVDPAVDRGQSYMDAGRVWFKDGTYVSHQRAIAFRNGDTYCVAPVVREPLVNQDGTNQLQTLSGFVLPKSGSVDFWAVGVNCCGPNGDDFTCGDSQSTYARAGMRLVDDNKRPMFLLAVQEWSSTTGLPVRHPLFFEWVKDPIVHMKQEYKSAWERFTSHTEWFVLVNIVLAICLSVVLRAMRIY